MIFLNNIQIMVKQNIIYIIVKYIKKIISSNKCRLVRYSWIFCYLVFVNILFFNKAYVLFLNSIYYSGVFKGEIFSFISCIFVSSVSICCMDFIYYMFLFIKNDKSN